MKEKTNVIDYGKSEEIMKKVEEVLKDLTLDEKFLILRFITDRLLKVKQQDDATNLIGNLPMGGMIKRVMGGS